MMRVVILEEGLQIGGKMCAGQSRTARAESKARSRGWAGRALVASRVQIGRGFGGKGPDQHGPTSFP